MARACCVCTHPKRAAIETAIDQEGYRPTSMRYKLQKDALVNHDRKHRIQTGNQTDETPGATAVAGFAENNQTANQTAREGDDPEDTPRDPPEPSGPGPDDDEDEDEDEDEEDEESGNPPEPVQAEIPAPSRFRQAWEDMTQVERDHARDWLAQQVQDEVYANQETWP